MKYKKMGIVMVIVSTVFGMPVMGDEADYLYVTGTNIPDCSMGIVSLEDVLKWDQSEDWKTYFKNCSVPFLLTVSDDMYFLVADSDGEYAYQISPSAPYASVSGGGPYLISCLDMESVSFQQETEEVQQFIEEKNKLKNSLKEKRKFVKEHLTEDDYGGIYYDERQRIDIFLVNNKWKDLLEKQGFQCIESDYPVTEQNSDINKLWRESNGLCIENIEKNVVETDGKKVQLMIFGRVEKEVSGIDLEQKNWEYIEGIWAPSGKSIKETFGDKDIANNIDWEDEETFVAAVREEYQYIENYIDPAYWDKLEQALKILKEQYPEYNCKNLYYHIAGDGDAMSYLNFDEELEKYVSETFRYQSSSNAVEEELFGDPAYLELKNMLRKYKEIYPDMKYQEIYKTYLRTTEESVDMSKREKLYWYLWQKYSFDKELEKLQEGKVTESVIQQRKQNTERSGKAQKTAIAGSIVLVLGVAAVKVWMKKCNEDNRLEKK